MARIFPYRGCPARSRTWSRWAFLRRLAKPLANHRWKSRIIPGVGDNGSVYGIFSWICWQHLVIYRIRSYSLRNYSEVPTLPGMRSYDERLRWKTRGDGPGKLLPNGLEPACTLGVKRALFDRNSSKLPLQQLCGLKAHRKWRNTKGSFR